MNQFTRTETTTRLRALAASCRALEYVGKRTKVEVGIRTIPVNIDHQPSQVETYAFDESDDLLHCIPLTEACAIHYVREYGSVVHLYVHNGEGYLEGVCVCWLGTPDQAPMVIDVDGKAVKHSTGTIEVFGVEFTRDQARRFHSYLAHVGRGLDFGPMQGHLEASGVATADGYGITSYTPEWADATKARGGGSGSAFMEEIARQLEA